MADDIESYEVIEFILGEKQEGDRIVFKSINDLEKAHQQIKDGTDIYVVKDGVVTKLLNQMISTKVYEGTLKLSAKHTKGGK